MGGSALWWSTNLDGDLTPGSHFEIWISLGKASGEDVRIGWQLIVADAAAPSAPLVRVDFLEDLQSHHHSTGDDR